MPLTCVNSSSNLARLIGHNLVLSLLRELATCVHLLVPPGSLEGHLFLECISLGMGLRFLLVTVVKASYPFFPYVLVVEGVA